MHHITLTFTPVRQPIDGRSVTARGLHGMLFNILAQADREESDWLHGHGSPRPFSFVPLYSDDGFLAGIRLAAINERAAVLFVRTGEWFQKEGRPCHLAGQEFTIGETRQTPGPTWQQLAFSQPVRQMGLHFTSPTAFKQGPGHLPLPLPGNIFGSSVRIWQSFAPPMMRLPTDWMDWCRREIFIRRHRIETVSVNISKQEEFTGFVGEVWLDAHRGNDAELSAWQALAELSCFCGVGHKTTMGMGSVQRIH